MAGKNMEVFPEIWKASDSKQKFGNISKHVERIRQQTRGAERTDRGKT